jgi:uncharacterized LabA/DUF88 family protein
MDWLAYNGFTVVTKPGKEFVDHKDRRKVRSKIDQMVLFSRDGDFTRLVEAMQRRGVRLL